MRHLLFILALLLPLPLAAQVALVGHVAAPTTSGGSLTTAAVNTTGANFYAVCVTTGYWGLPSNPLTDSLENTYVEVNGLLNSVGEYLLVSFGATAGPAVTWTAGNGVVAINVMAFSNVASGPDQQATANNSWSGSYLYTGSVTPTNANELVIGCLGFNGAVAATTAVSPMILADTNLNAFVATGASAYEIQAPGPTAINPTFSGGGYNGVAGATASFYSTASPAPLVITNTAVPEGFNGVAYTSTGSLYSNQFAATGGAQPYTWSVSSGTLPTGLSLSSGGLLTGTPTGTVSARSITFMVTDAHSTTATVTLPITVASTLLSVTAPTNCPVAIQYQAYSGCSFTITAGGTAPLTFSIPAATNDVYPPEGISVDPSTGAISGTFYGGGEYTFAAQLSDSLGSYSAASFTFKGNETVLPGSEWPCNSSSIWCHRIDSLPADTSPLGTVASPYAPAYLRFFTNDGGNTGAIPQIIVPCTQPYVPVIGTQYFSSAPIPPYAPIEAGPGGSGNGNDHHVLVIMQGCGSTPAQEFDLYSYGSYTQSGNSGWEPAGGGSGYQWNVTGSPTTNFGITMPLDQSNADNLGGPMAQTIWKVDDIIGSGTESSPTGAITYPQRLIISQLLNRFVWPATTPNGVGGCTDGYEDSSHMVLQQDAPATCTGPGGSSTGWPSGEMLRLNSTFSIPSCASGNPYAAILFTAMQEYGFVMADQGMTGSVSLSPDERWASIPQLASALSCIGSTVQLQDLQGVNVSSLMPTITSWSLTSNILSATTQSASGFFTGQKVRLVPQNSGDSWLNTSLTGTSYTAANPGTFTITSTPTPTTFTADITTGGITHTDVTTNTDPVYVFTYQTTGGSPTPAATPSFSPAAGTYSVAQTVTISSATGGASIVYCQDTVNTCTPGTSYSTPVSVSATGYLRAQATAAGYTASSVGSAAYTIGVTPTGSTFSGRASGVTIQ